MKFVTDYQEIAEGITLIDTGFVRPRFTASFLLVEGQQAAFVDVGTSSAVPELLAALRHKAISPEQVKYIILTHIHLDHAGGAGELLRHLPHARLVVHPKGSRHLISPNRLVKSSIEVYGEERFRQFFGDVTPIAKERIIEAAHGLRLDLGGRDLLILDTPGHARHHICLVDNKSQGIFTGDTFGISFREFDTEQGPLIFPTCSPVHFEPEKMHESIDLLLSYQPQQMYVTHFGVIGNVAALAEDLHCLINEYVALAESVTGNNNYRSRVLTENMTSLFFSRVRSHGSDMNEEHILQLLTPDIMLNVRGLEVWLDRKRKF